MNSGDPAVVSVAGVTEDSFHGYLDQYSSKDDWKAGVADLSTLEQVARSIFGGSYKGVWAAGTFAVDDVVWYDDSFYACTTARTASDTDNPATDTGSWEVTKVASGGGSGGLDQTTFNTRMENVPDATKDTYKGSGGGGGDYSEANLHDHLDSYGNKDDFKADVSGLLTDHQDMIDALGYALHGDSYKGEWAAGTFAIGDYVSNETKYYRCTTARTSSNTDDPSVDTGSWSLVTDIQADLDNLAAGLTTIDSIVDTNNTFLGSSTFGLNALRTLINAIPTSNPSASDIATAVDAPTASEIATAVEGSQVGIDATAIKTAVESASHGLAALKTLIDTIDTVVDANKTLLEDGTNGLAALKTLIDTVDTVVDSNKATLDHATHGLSALQVLIAALPSTTAPTTAQIVSAIQAADFDEGTGTDTILQVLADIKTAAEANKSTLEDGTSGLSALKALLDTISGYADILDDGANGLAALRTLIAAIPTSGLTAAEVTAAVPTVAQIISGIQAADFSSSSGVQSLASVLDAIAAELTDNNTHLESGDYGLSALKTLIEALDDTTLEQIARAIFGEDYQGEWSAGDFAVDEVVWHSDRFYRCTVARDSTNTDNPATDTSSWEIAQVEAGSGGSGTIDQATFDQRMAAVPEATKNTYKGSGSSSYSEANLHDHLDSYGNKDGFKADVSSIPTDHMDQSTFDARLNAYGSKDDWKADVTALANSSHGLPALKTLLDTISGYTDLIDDGASGLAAIKTAIDAIPTDDVNALLTSGTSGLAALKALLDTISGYADLIDDSASGLAAIKSAVDAIPTSNPSASDIASAVDAPTAAEIASAVDVPTVSEIVSRDSSRGLQQCCRYAKARRCTRWDRSRCCR